jgi:hypothetical protein
MPVITLHSLDNANELQEQFAGKAVGYLMGVVNNVDFLRKIRYSNFTRRRFCTDAGAYIEASNPYILKIIASGKERNTQPDNSIDLNVKIATLYASTAGRIIPPDPLITTNALFFNSWMYKNDALSLAAHWMHEWLHVAGFRHVKLPNGDADRRDVNYTIGRYVVEIGRQETLRNGEAPAVANELGKGYIDAVPEHLNTVVEKNST